MAQPTTPVMIETGFTRLTMAFDRRGVAALNIGRIVDDVMVDEMMWAFAMLTADPRVSVITLGIGVDHKLPHSTDHDHGHDHHAETLMDLVKECPKPVIGRIEGAGQGLAPKLAGVCDIVLNSKRSHGLERVLGTMLANAFEAMDRADLRGAFHSAAGQRSFRPAPSTQLLN